MTEDEKTIKAWAYEKLMNVLYESAHLCSYKNVSFYDADIQNFIKTMAPDFWKAIKEKVKNERQMEEQDEV